MDSSGQLHGQSNYLHSVYQRDKTIRTDAFFVHCRFEDFTPYQEKYVIKLYDSGCLILQQYIHINKNRQQNFKTDFIGNRAVLNPMFQGIQLQIKQTNIMNKV